MSVAASSAFYPSAGTFPDTVKKITTQLDTNDINIVVLAHYTALASKLIEHLYSDGWFDRAPPERPRVFIVINSPIPDMMDLSRPMTLKLLKTAAWIRISVKSLDLPNLYPQFLSDYHSEEGRAYPHQNLVYFTEAYACAYAMVAGLHRLALVNGTTFETVAARSKGVFESMSLSLFNLTQEASLSTRSPVPRINAALDSTGDPIPIYSILHATTPILDTNGNLTSTTEILFATVPSGQNVSLIPFSFPGLSAGRYPLDAQPVTVHVATWGSSTGLITIISVGVCTAITFATAAFLIRSRKSPIVRRSCLTVLLLQHFASLSLYWNALAHLDVPTTYVCNARTVTSSMGLGLFLMLIYTRLTMLYQVQTFRQNTAGQLITRGSSPKEDQRQEQVQPDTRRLSGFRKATSAPRPPPVIAGGSDSNKRVTDTSSVDSSVTASLWKQATNHAGRHLSEKAAVLRHFRVGRRASAHIDAMVTRIEDLIGALNGTRPKSMHRCLLQHCGPFVVLFACAGAYFFTSCQQEVRQQQFEPDKFELKCTCMDASSNTMSWLFIFLVNFALLLLSLYLGWATRRVRFNVYESRRSIFALVNGMVGTGLYVYIQSNQAFSPNTLFYALLVTFLSISTLGFYVTPLYLRMYNNKVDGEHVSRVDSSEDLSFGLSKTSAASTALEEAGESVPAGRPIMIRQRTISAVATVPGTTPGGQGGLHATIPEANEPAIQVAEISTDDVSPRNNIPVYDVVQSGDEASLMVAAFPVLAKHHAPRSVVGHIGHSALRLLGPLFGQETRTKREWMKLQLWCIAGTEQGVGLVQLSGMGFNKDSLRLGGPFASFEARLADAGISGEEDVVGTSNTRSMGTSQSTPNSARASQLVLLYGRHSHTSLLIQFPQSQLAAHFVSLFTVKPVTIRSSERAMGMMSTF